MLTRKFLLYFLVPLTCLLVGAQAWFYSAAATRLGEQAEQRLGLHTLAIDAEITHLVAGIQNDLRVIATDPSFAEYHRLRRFSRLEAADRTLMELEGSLVSVARLKTEYRTIRWCDATGHTLVSIVDGRRAYGVQDHSASPWFSRATQLASGGSDVLLQRLPDSSQTTLIVSGPKHHDGVLTGALSIEVEAGEFLKRVLEEHPLGPDSYAYLADSEGVILTHTDSQRIDDASRNRVVGEALAGHVGTSSSTVDSMRILQSYRPLSVAGMVLVVAVPEAEVLAPIAAVRNVGIPIVLVVMLTLGVFGANIVRRLILPIQHMTQVVGRVAEGDLEVKSEFRGDDELGQLSEGLNRMILNLQISRHAMLFSAETVAKSEENLRITLNSIGDGVISTDAEGLVTGMNPVAETLTGFAVEEAVGKPLVEVFHIVNRDTRERVDSPVELVLQTGKIVGLANHTVLIAQDGTERHITDSGAPICDEDGRIVGVVLVLRDVTERVRMTERLFRSQKMDSVGQLAGGIAHDFNNQLSVIMGNAELLRIGLNGPTDMGKLPFANSIVDASRRAAVLVSQLLTFSRERDLVQERMQFSEVVEAVVVMASRTFDKRVVIECLLEDDEQYIFGEKAALESAVLNLAINARDAMPDGGTLTFATDIVTVKEGGRRNRELGLDPGFYLQLTVGDTGTGMSAATRERIFEPFFTTKAVGAGTGLGLATVYGAIGSHGGAIDCESQLGAGTNMFVLLPLCESDARAKPVPSSKLVRGRGHILLVDDEPEILKSVCLQLEGLGYKVTCAQRSPSAIEIYTLMPQAFDLVILDMIMPEMSGREILEHLLNVRSDCRVLIVTGHSQGVELERVQRLGVEGVLRKPFSARDLSQAVADAIGPLESQTQPLPGDRSLRDS